MALRAAAQCAQQPTSCSTVALGAAAQQPTSCSTVALGAAVQQPTSCSTVALGAAVQQPTSCSTVALGAAAQQPHRRKLESPGGLGAFIFYIKSKSLNSCDLPGMEAFRFYIKNKTSRALPADRARASARRSQIAPGPLADPRSALKSRARCFASILEPLRLRTLRPPALKIDRPSKYRILPHVSKQGL